jgi:hypothetical protein
MTRPQKNRRLRGWAAAVQGDVMVTVAGDPRQRQTDTAEANTPSAAGQRATGA